MARKPSPNSFSWEPLGPRQAELRRTIHEADVVLCHGPAGTGKTLVALFTGLTMLDDPKSSGIENVVLTRPLVTVENEQVGYLPGDMKQKTDPYMAPFLELLKYHPRYQEFTRTRDPGDEKPRDAPALEARPLAYMRGVTFNSTYILADEMQNATQAQTEMLLTRLGKGSKMVLTGDPSQCDLRCPGANGFAHALRLFEGHPRIRTVEFTLADIQRHDLVGEVIRTYAQSRSQKPEFT